MHEDERSEGVRGSLDRRFVVRDDRGPELTEASDWFDFEFLAVAAPQESSQSC